MKIPFLNWEIRAKPSVRPAPDDDYWYTNTTTTTASGQDVNQDTALTYSAVWACVKVLSEDIASLPLFVYRRAGEGKQRAIDHPLYYLLHDAPNPEMTALQFREALMGHLLTWGNCYAQIQRDLRGQPFALWPLNPANMDVERDESNNLIYDYKLTKTGERVIFQPRDIFHVCGLSPNGLVGYSPISYAREAIGCGLAAQTTSGSTLQSGGRLQLAFVHPAPKAPGADARRAFRDELRKEYGGSSGQRIGVFWEGMEPKPISMPMDDMEFVDQRKYTRTEICAIFRVPPHLIMDLERATFSNIEQQAISYVTNSIRPWCVRWEQAINQRLLDGNQEYFAEHMVEGLLRGDIASRYDAYTKARNWGWLSVNEIRAYENLNPIPEGDSYLQPLNMIELGQEPPAPAPQQIPAAQDEKQAASEKLKLITRRD